MSQNVQSVTLSLTLPISCQICLGKVRKPTICCNNHVFCFGCIDVWLKKSNQCPTCRVPITPENPCREIIGATNDSESNESYSVKKRLRKTRGELLLREYEDEIETLLKENEELRSKNSSLEAQLHPALEPSSILVSQSDAPVDHSLLEESANKLRVANDLCKKLQQDMDKLKEVNRALRSQNADLIHGNTRLKVEVENRSPQKFGRFTVAALEAKILQYEREMSQLKRALERSDRYIEELEGQVADSQRRVAPPADEAKWKGSASDERQGTAQHNRIATMRRSLSEMEEALVCTDLDKKSTRTGLPEGCGFLLTTSDVHHGGDLPYGAVRPVEEALWSVSIPSTPPTPSSSLRCLSLSPAGCGEARPSYLRRLRFGDQISKNGTFSHGSSLQTAKQTDWGDRGGLETSSSLCGNVAASAFRPGACVGGAAGHCEDSMDAAYLDKISELDSMMAEGEGSSSQTSWQSPRLPLMPDFSVLLTADVEADTDLLTDPCILNEEQATPTAHDITEAKKHAPFRVPEKDAGSSTVAAKDREGSGKDREGSGKDREGSAESQKRKCAVSLATCSPSKLSKMTI